MYIRHIQYMLFAWYDLLKGVVWVASFLIYGNMSPAVNAITIESAEGAVPSILNRVSHEYLWGAIFFLEQSNPHNFWVVLKYLTAGIDYSGRQQNVIIPFTDVLAIFRIFLVYHIKVPAHVYASQLRAFLLVSRKHNLFFYVIIKYWYVLGHVCAMKLPEPLIEWPCGIYGSKNEEGSFWDFWA